jgi:hypothetical protein
MTQSPFTVADLTQARTRPNRSGFTYSVRYVPRLDPHATSWPPAEFESSVTGIAPTLEEAAERLAEHVNRIAVGFDIVCATINANKFFAMPDGIAQRQAR